MEKEQLVYAIIALAVLLIIIIGVPKLLSATQKGLSKESLECTYLKFIPFLCSEEDKQKLDEAKQKALLEEQQKKYAKINKFMDTFSSTFETCGKDSKKTLCKCNLDFTPILNSPTYINKQPDGVYLVNTQTGFRKKFEGLNELYINDNSNNLVDITKLYGTNSVLFDTKGDHLVALTGTPPKIIKEFPSTSINIAVLKQGNKRGIYIKGFATEPPSC